MLAYQKQEWPVDSTITREKLEHMEKGIAAAVQSGTLKFQLTDAALQCSVDGGAIWSDICARADITGPAGPQGQQGPTGAKGTKGDAGPEGPKGDPGAGLTGDAASLASLAADADLTAATEKVNEIVAALIARGVASAPGA